MSAGESERKAEHFRHLASALDSMTGADIERDEELVSYWVPGRIEVLGKHTDYGGGRSLLCAVERGICVSARPHRRGNAKPKLRIVDVRSGEQIEIDLSDGVIAVPGSWSNYPITVVRRVASNFDTPLRGADVAFSSDLPPAAGVSSSSALVVAMFLVLSAVNDLPSTENYRRDIRTCEDLAGYLGCVENGLDFKGLHGHAGVGTFGGSEDQTAILCSRPKSLVQYSFCPVTFERVISVPTSYRFVIAASGFAAEKTGAAMAHYNRVSTRLSVGLELWRRATGRPDASMGEAIASSPDARERIRKILGATTNTEFTSNSLVERFDQFDVESNVIIPAGGDALARGDLITFGSLVAQSQDAAERGLGNQIPATVTLVRQARELGAIAASAFGAGFGGSVWALVHSPSVGTFRRKWSAAYAEAFPEAARRSDFFSTATGPPAVRL